MRGYWDGLQEAVAIADVGSFKGAAKLLNVSTSHVSKVISRLEARLKTRLFLRTTRHVELTSEGRAFVEQSRQIIKQRDALVSHRDLSDEPQGKIRVTCAISLGERFVAPLIRIFAKRHPKIAISLNLTNRLVDLIGEGYDLAVRTTKIADGRLVGRQVASREVVTVASPAYLAAHGTPVSINDLKSHNCLVGSTPTWTFFVGGHSRPFVPRGKWNCNSGTVITEAAVAGEGICQLPFYYVSDYLTTGTLVHVLADWQPHPQRIWLAIPKRPYAHVGASALAAFLSSELQLAMDRAANTELTYSHVCEL